MLLALKINISPLLLFLCEKLRDQTINLGLSNMLESCHLPPNQIRDFSLNPPSHSRMSVYVGTAGLRSQTEMLYPISAFARRNKTCHYS